MASASSQLAAMHGDAALLRRAGRGRRARDDRRTSATAISTRSRDFRDPALIDRGLQAGAARRELRSQDTARYLAPFFGNPDAREPRAWAFVKRNWTELEPKVSDLACGDAPA